MLSFYKFPSICFDFYLEISPLSVPITNTRHYRLMFSLGFAIETDFFRAWKKWTASYVGGFEDDNVDYEDEDVDVDRDFMYHLIFSII